jgi:hypothetical protein
MKKNLKRWTIVGVVIVITLAGFVLVNKYNWKTYTNSNPAFSFMFPRSWGEPRVYDNKEKLEFQIDFGNYSFSVNNGYYFGEINNKRATVSDIIQYYEADKKRGNEIREYKTKEIEVDHHPAVEVIIETLVGKNYKDVFIYQYPDKTNPDKYILITGNEEFIDGVTFDRVISSFKFR